MGVRGHRRTSGRRERRRAVERGGIRGERERETSHTTYPTYNEVSGLAVVSHLAMKSWSICIISHCTILHVGAL